MTPCPRCRQPMAEHCSHGKCGWLACRDCGIEYRTRDGKTVVPKTT